MARDSESFYLALIQEVVAKLIQQDAHMPIMWRTTKDCERIRGHGTSGRAGPPVAVTLLAHLVLATVIRSRRRTSTRNPAEGKHFWSLWPPGMVFLGDT